MPARLWHEALSATQRHGTGTFFDRRFADTAQYAISGGERLGKYESDARPEHLEGPRCTSDRHPGDDDAEKRHLAADGDGYYIRSDQQMQEA